MHHDGWIYSHFCREKGRWNRVSWGGFLLFPFESDLEGFFVLTGKKEKLNGQEK